MHWFEEFDLNDQEILTGFTFAHECTKSTFDEQYVKKWDRFTSLYDFRGPDLNIV